MSKITKEQLEKLFKVRDPEAAENLLDQFEDITAAGAVAKRAKEIVTDAVQSTPTLFSDPRYLHAAIEALVVTGWLDGFYTRMQIERGEVGEDEPKQDELDDKLMNAEIAD